MAKKTVLLKDKKSKSSFTITYSQPFAATVQDGDQGDKILNIKSKRYYQHQLNKFKVGEKLTLELHNRKPKRSEAQNSYQW